MTLKDSNKWYIYAYEPVFTWSHFLTKRLKWIIKGGTGSEICHMSYSYDYAGQKEFIKQTTFDKGCHSVDYMPHFKERYSKIYAHEVKVPIDLARLHEFTKSHLGEKYRPERAFYSAIDRIPIVNKLWKYFFKIEENSDDVAFCNNFVVLALQDQGYLKHIKDVNSLSPEETKKEIQKYGLCYSPMLVWNKSYFVNNVFKK
jgi:hypothetical protein